MKTTNQPTRRAFLASVAAIGASFGGAMALASAPAGASGLSSLLGAVLPEETQKTVHVGMIDISASSGAESATLYREAMARFLAGARNGDQIVLVTVSDSRRIVPQSIAVEATGNVLTDKRAKKNALKKADAFIDAALTGPQAKSTRILETLGLMRPYLDRSLEQGYKVRICLCSDAMETSGLADFSKLSEKRLEALLATVAQEDLYVVSPDRAATGAVEMLFCGAGGDARDVARLAQAFWDAYCRRARINLAFYGRTMPVF